jgi:SAM-dependent methyltransferase
VCVTSLKNGKVGNTKKSEKEERTLRSSPRRTQFQAYLNSRISAEGFPLPPKQQGDEREKEEVSESSTLLAETQVDIVLTRPTDRPKTAGQIPAFQSHDQRKSSVQATDRPKTAGQIANLQSRAKIIAQVKFAKAMMVQNDNVGKQQQRETVHQWRLQKKEEAAREAAKKEQRAKEEAEAWAVRVRACRSQLHLLKSHSMVNTASVPHSPRPPPEALVCLDRTRQCFEDLRKQFEEDLTSTKIALAPPEPLRVVNKAMSVVDTKEGTPPTSPRQRKERHQFTFREGGGDGTAWDRRFSQQAGGGVNDEWYISYQESAELQAYLRGVLDPSALIVQVGCGNSRLAPALYDDGYKFLINVDISKVAVGVMQRKFRETHPSLVFIAGDATCLAWPDEILDVVLDKGTLQSLLLLEDGVARVAKFAREIWRVLRPGGKMIQIMAGKGMQTYLNLSDLRWTIKHKVIPRKGPGGVANVYKFTKPFCHGALRPTTT